MSIKLLSFDIGIKNMAYCYLNYDNKIVDIYDWGVLNLMTEDNSSHKTCCFMMNGKKKNDPSKICGKKAKYYKNSDNFCEKHAKKNDQYMIPTKENELSYLKKQKIDELLKIARSHFLFMDYEKIKPKKDEIVTGIHNFFQNNCFQQIKVSKKKTAGETDLIEIGKNMKQCLNRLSNIDDVSHVIIENQISPIATRMKTIQGMLAQYFIMKNENTQIHFVSSSHKLKQFIDIAPNNYIIDTSQPNNQYKPKKNPNYKENKKDGIYYTNIILNNNNHLQRWRDSMNTTKKDDLADSFLQGLWFFKDRKIIYYADDLKINIV
jgi:hypothetical protein